jgi:hypothetical protein
MLSWKPKLLDLIMHCVLLLALDCFSLFIGRGRGRGDQKNEFSVFDQLCAEIIAGVKLHLQSI